MVRDKQPKLCDELKRLKLEIVEQGHLHTMTVKYNLEDCIRLAQRQCPELQNLKRAMRDGKATDYRVYDQGTIWLKDRICVPQDQGIRTEILDEAHNSKYAIHPGCTKMYQDLKDRF
jgi:hypothetical protein